MDILKLKEAGIDYNEGVKRFVNKSDLYEKFLLKFFQEPTFSLLEEAMKNKDYEQAFKLAHNLKGMSGNLSLNEFYASLYSFVELLRSEKNNEAEVFFEKLVVLYDEAKQAVLENA